MTGLAVLIPVLEIGLRLVWHSTWFVGYDLNNCPGCVPKIDWSNSSNVEVVSPEKVNEFDEKGAVLFSNALPVELVQELAKEVDALPNTFMTDVLARTLLPQYMRYEHHLETRSELVRDWALHGPLSKWAAELMNVDQVRLYNAEAIYHAGEASPNPCKPAWHRDTIAAPFPTNVRSVTFNIYFEDIGADAPNGDGLIYMSGSHKDLTGPPTNPNIIEHYVRVGDVLAHDAHSYHTTSGRGCWRRRSMQFRYVAGNDNEGKLTTFQFGRNRFPHGPVPWSLAQAPELYPHGLDNGDLLQGHGYPLAFPAPLEAEHVPLTGNIWSLKKIFELITESGEAAKQLPKDFFAMDGPIVDPEDWVSQSNLPMHKRGATYQIFKETGEI